MSDKCVRIEDMVNGIKTVGDSLNKKINDISKSNLYKENRLIRKNFIDLSDAININKFNLRGHTNEINLESTFENKKVIVKIDGVEHLLNLSEPLYSIRGFYDYIDFINKKLYKRIVCKVLNGNEDWALVNSDNTLLYFRLNVTETKFIGRIDEGTILYMQDENIQEICIYDRQLTVKFKKGKLQEDTLEKFKLYLQQNNKKVFYINKNYTVSDLNIDFELTNSQIELNYDNNTSFIDCEYTTYKPKNKQRIFKPNFCSCIDYTGTPIDANGTIRHIEDARLDADSERMGQLGLDSTIMVFDTSYNESTQEMFFINTDETFLSYARKYQEKGVIIEKVKLHTWFFRGGEDSNSTYIKNVITKERFITQYTEIVKHLIQLVKTNLPTVKDIIILNELDDGEYNIVQDTELEQFILNCLKLIKDAGYNCGISNSNASNTLGMLESIKQYVSKFYINSYFVISPKEDKTTEEDGIKNISNSLSLKMMKYLYSEYGKKIYISETGCLDNWAYLISPASYDLNDINKYPYSYGKTEYLYINSIFNTLNLEFIEGVCYWWDICYEKVIPLINYYLKGSDL